MRDYKKLEIWKRSHQLALNIYKTSESFPRTEIFGLTSQLRRASTSVAINIAEGCGRYSQAELARFLVISSGSLSEVEYILLLCKELKYIPEQEFQPLNKEANEIKRMLFSYHKKLKKTKS